MLLVEDATALSQCLVGHELQVGGGTGLSEGFKTGLLPLVVLLGDAMITLLDNVFVELLVDAKEVASFKLADRVDGDP